MTRYADEKAYVWEHYAAIVENTSPRTISRDHFEHACDMLIDRVERAIEAKYNSGERAPWTKDIDARYIKAVQEATFTGMSVAEQAVLQAAANTSPGIMAPGHYIGGAYSEAREQKVAALLNLACTGQLVVPEATARSATVGALAAASANAVAAGVAAGNSLSKSPRAALIAKELSELTTMVEDWADRVLPGSRDVTYEVSCDGCVMLKIWSPFRVARTGTANSETDVETGRYNELWSMVSAWCEAQEKHPGCSPDVSSLRRSLDTRKP